MITFNIPFDEKKFLDQNKLKAKLMYGKSLRNIRNIGILGLILLSLGLIAGSDDKYYFNPFTIMGIVWLSLDFFVGLIFYTVLRMALKGKNKVFKEIIENKYESHYEFSEIGILFSNKIQRYEIIWEGVKGYSIVDDNVFVMLTKSIDGSFVIGKNEIDEDIYSSLEELLKTKVKYVETKR